MRVVLACVLRREQNNLHELWALLNFLLPSVFQDSEAFNRVFDLNVDDTDKKQNMITQLHKILRCVLPNPWRGWNQEPCLARWW